MMLFRLISQEILNWVIDSPLLDLDACMKSHCSLVWALTLETIWNLINKVLLRYCMEMRYRSSLLLYVGLNNESMNSRILVP